MSSLSLERRGVAEAFCPEGMVQVAAAAATVGDFGGYRRGGAAEGAVGGDGGEGGRGSDGGGGATVTGAALGALGACSH